jgi:hypothetical protein
VNFESPYPISDGNATCFNDLTSLPYPYRHPLTVRTTSWNLYGANVNQSLIQGIMDGMVSKARMVDGKPTSLCDLGYCDVG